MLKPSPYIPCENIFSVAFLHDNYVGINNFEVRKVGFDLTVLSARSDEASSALIVTFGSGHLEERCGV